MEKLVLCTNADFCKLNAKPFQSAFSTPAAFRARNDKTYIRIQRIMVVFVVFVQRSPQTKACPGHCATAVAGFPPPNLPQPPTRCPADCLLLDEDARMSQVCDSLGSFCGEKNMQMCTLYELGYVNTGSSAAFVISGSHLFFINYFTF